MLASASADITIHSLFERQVSLSPNKIALQMESEAITYEELNVKANQLAFYLNSIGIDIGDNIALFLESSVEVISGILGILKSGATYVPINPMFPAIRVETILENIDAKIIFTLSNLVEKIPSTFTGKVIVLDADFSLWDDGPRHNPDRYIPEHTVAYIAYTSGSTGSPKGVMVMHRGTVNFLNFLKNTYPITASDLTLQMIPFYFNGSVREVFGTLVNGATLVMLKQPKVNDASAMLALIDAIDRYGITLFLSMVPAVMKYVIRMSSISGKKFSNIKLILIAGESVYYKTIQEIKNAFSENTTIINQYGQTESSGVATFYVIDKVCDEETKVPIGKPIDNCSIHILDDDLQPVETGDSGHIYIGGRCLAQGYLNLPEATKNSFVTDANHGTATLLKTGDIGRLTESGDIEFLSREGEMLIFEGYRIEPGEIERTLEKHVAVQSVAVVIQKDEISNASFLNCYYTLTEKAAIKPKELLKFGKQNLPYFMIPSSFIEVDKFPLKPNGKLDRRALAES